MLIKRCIPVGFDQDICFRFALSNYIQVDIDVDDDDFPKMSFEMSLVMPMTYSSFFLPWNWSMEQLSPKD